MAGKKSQGHSVAMLVGLVIVSIGDIFGGLDMSNILTGSGITCHQVWKATDCELCAALIFYYEFGHL